MSRMIGAIRGIGACAGRDISAVLLASAALVRYRGGMSEERIVVAMIGNPVSAKGKGAKVHEQVFSRLAEAGVRHGFDVVDLTGASRDESLSNACTRRHEYDHLVVVGGDGMIALGANAVGGSGVPLGIVATGSGNDFARGLGLPVNRIDVAVDGIVGAIVRGSHIDVDLGHVVSMPGGYAVDATTAAPLTAESSSEPSAEVTAGASAGGDACAEPIAATPADSDLLGLEPVGSDSTGPDSTGSDPTVPVSAVPAAADSVPAVAGPPIDRYYGGMLACGLDSSINDRANRSHLPGGSLRYLAAVLVEVSRLKQYGYHIKATLVDGSVEERDVISPMLTVANSRYVGGGLEVSPYSRLTDGLLDLVWIDHMPNPLEIADAISKAYVGKLMASSVFGWQRVRDVEITRADEGAEPPVIMADGEYVGYLPVKVAAGEQALRVLVPPAVASAHADDDGSRTLAMMERDHRDPLTGELA